MNPHHNTIFALCTPPTRSPLHVQRISGRNILESFCPFLKNTRTGEAISGEKWPPKTATPRTLHARLVNTQGETLDEVLLTGFAAPNSFTGEDVVEISSHGNPIILAKIQSHLRSMGFRDALPGEFTQRAFLNGKVDLTAAEAIHEIIAARSENAIKLALRAAEGSIAREIKKLREQLLTILAYLEAHIDFDESDVGTYDPTQIFPAVTTFGSKLGELAHTYDAASCARNGVRVCIAGRPNAGKSTLFNAILKKERAIVTEIAGTTRDVLEDHYLFRNRDFVFQDTAGLRTTEDKVEQIGIQRSQASMAASDIVCLLCDASLASTAEQAEAEFIEVFEEVKELIANKVVIVVVSKVDITPPNLVEAIKQMAKKLTSSDAVTTSPSEVELLLERLCDSYDLCANLGILQAPAVLISTRQRDCVLKAQKLTLNAEDALRNREYPEAVASLLCLAKNEIEDIVGVVTPNDVLENLFSHFCIGK
jgi:tRNA modification GTPase